jgi:DNA-binding MarR family transcriptional regulator
MPQTRVPRAGTPMLEARAAPNYADLARSWRENSGIRASTTTKIPLGRAPVPMARRFLQIATAVWAEACAEESLNHYEFGALSQLLINPEIDRNGLAAYIGVDRTNIGLILKSLEKCGFIERRVNPNDRRAQLMRMTVLGEQAFMRQTLKVAKAREKILAPLTKAERETLYDLLEKVIAGNEQYSIPGAGRRKRYR